MIETVKRWLYKSRFVREQMRSGGELDYGREIIAGWMRRFAPELAASSEVHILDIGCGSGRDLLEAKAALADRQVHLYGLDCVASHVEALKTQGITAHRIDIEREPFPFPDRLFDVIIANQTIEHVKEIFWIFAECSRVVKRGGYLIVGVPNLAALHNRILLTFGDQPVAIHVLGPHVRGFTKKGLQRFLEAEGIFRIVDFKGSHLYLLPQWLSKFLVRWRPGIASNIFFLVQRADVDRNFIEVLKGLSLETNYFQGP